MAWLARSIANSLKLDEDDEDVEKPRPGDESAPNQSVSETQSPRGVKEDISELTKTLRSQFWGVASFLSQESSSSSSSNHRQSPDHAEEEEEEEDLIAGIRNDFAEIGGRFRTGISKLSENLPVSDFTKIASNFLQLGSEGVDPRDVIGVSEEVVAFVRDLAMHPETWLDLPLPDEDEDDDDTFDGFEMSDDQHEHAVAMERLVPSLASLRIEICPEYMTENCFWMIYFVLLHPKLNQHDALLLSTPKVLEARAMLSHELREINRAPEEGESSEANVEPLAVPYNPSSQESLVAKTVTPQECETDKHSIESTEEMQVVVDKSVIEERNSSTDSSSSSRFINVRAEDVEEEEDADDWLNDEETSEPSAIEGVGVTTKNPVGEEDEEDVSFSDLEEDDEEGDVPVSSKKSTNSSSPDWVQI